MNQYEMIAEKIKEADAILIGASNGLSIAEGYNLFANDERFQKTFSDFKRKYGIQNALQGSFEAYSSENEMQDYFSRLVANYVYDAPPSELLTDLYKLVKDKPHFVVTSNGDNHLVRAGFNKENVFEIEGNLTEMQCANGCHDTLYPGQDVMTEMLIHEEGMEIPDEYLPRCPKCGGPMLPHLPLDEAFIRGKEWQDRYSDYQTFVKENHGKDLLVLEFGIGARNQMIKAPFMKLVEIEPNASYITFNKGEIYIPQQIADKSIGIDGDLSEILPEILKAYNKE